MGKVRPPEGNFRNYGNSMGKVRPPEGIFRNYGNSAGKVRPPAGIFRNSPGGGAEEVPGKEAEVGLDDAKRLKTGVPRGLSPKSFSHST